MCICLILVLESIDKTEVNFTSPVFVLLGFWLADSLGIISPLVVPSSLEEVLVDSAAGTVTD